MTPDDTSAASSSSAGPLPELIRQVKQAIEQAEARLPDAALTVTQVVVEVKTTLEKKVGAGGKIRWLPIPIELSAAATRARTQVITVKLEPEPQPVLMGEVADELADAIFAVHAGVEEARRRPPHFRLAEATVKLEIGTTREGKIKVLAGAEADGATTHTVTLTLAARS
ncbi:MAG: hypothetical protein EA422_15100 [Gemmatimonadales bacterium]|nr:MAG: hypothetical protein EA422_15100 [Gemmatimonadales bacterium]